MFESRISARATEKLLGWEKSQANTIALSYDVEGQAKECMERYCKLAKNVSSTVHGVYTMSRRPSLQKGRVEIRGRLVKSLLSNCLEMSL